MNGRVYLDGCYSAIQALLRALKVIALYRRSRNRAGAPAFNCSTALSADQGSMMLSVKIIQIQLEYGGQFSKYIDGAGAGAVFDL